MHVITLAARIDANIAHQRFNTNITACMGLGETS